MIYVASSWRNNLQPLVVSTLRAAGFEVYDFKDPGDGTDGFRWTEIYPDHPKWTPQQWRSAVKHPIALKGFANDKSAIDRCDICVLVLPCGRSAHLEAGFMAGKGKRVLTLAIDPVEPELMNLLLGSADEICTSMEELLDTLGRVK